MLLCDWLTTTVKRYKTVEKNCLKNLSVVMSYAYGVELKCLIFLLDGVALSVFRVTPAKNQQQKQTYNYHKHS